MNRRRGCIWFAAGILLALLAGTVAFTAIQRSTELPKQVEEPVRVPALVASRDIPLRTVISTTDVTIVQVPPELLPADAVTDPQAAAGYLTSADIAQGEIILARRLIAPTYVGPRAAFVMSPTEVLVAFPAVDLLSSLGIVRAGDRIDLMYSFDFSKGSPKAEPGLRTLTVLPDLRIAGVIGGTDENGNQTATPQAYLLAVNPQDALMLKWLRDQGGAPDPALRSPSASGPFDTQTVDGDYMMQRFNIREQMRVQQ